MKRKLIFGVVVLLLATPLFLGSCIGISQDVYDDVVKERDLAREEVSALRTDLDVAQATIDALQSDLETVQEQLDALQTGGKFGVTLGDLYYERHNYEEGISFENLVAELTLENKRKETIYILNNYLEDAKGTVYHAVLRLEKGQTETCLSCGDPSVLIYVPAGMKVSGYFIVISNVPKDTIGLELTIETDISQEVLSLPDASSIRISEILETSR